MLDPVNSARATVMVWLAGSDDAGTLQATIEQ